MKLFEKLRGLFKRKPKEEQETVVKPKQETLPVVVEEKPAEAKTE